MTLCIVVSIVGLLQQDSVNISGKTILDLVPGFGEEKNKVLVVPDCKERKNREALCQYPEVLMAVGTGRGSSAMRGARKERGAKMNWGVLPLWPPEVLDAPLATRPYFAAA
ncbi:hypothetical protein Cadr_000026340 [Camelus dromedarius]|uniref:Uncharacterized protein n=1 Tax=Camelus dromedarius TaxID=9838 RepID=A0A5N4CEI7_CAMDR|nr:hypothetical protein Cadr_000026340 [Camelus dromedarius]